MSCCISEFVMYLGLRWKVPPICAAIDSVIILLPYFEKYSISNTCTFLFTVADEDEDEESGWAAQRGQSSWGGGLFHTKYTFLGCAEYSVTTIGGDLFKYMQCQCDTDDCNRAAPADLDGFSCYAGDVDLAALEMGDVFENGTFSSNSFGKALCYTNREQCFQTIYNGIQCCVMPNAKKWSKYNFVLGTNGQRMVFGCAPYELRNMTSTKEFVPVEWNQYEHLRMTEFFNTSAIVEGRTCNFTMCNPPYAKDFTTTTTTRSMTTTLYVDNSGLNMRQSFTIPTMLMLYTGLINFSLEI